MSQAEAVSEVVEHLFRREAGKIVAILTRIFGIEHLQLAEDVVQEALVRALQSWPFYGVPENPSAWILRASRNLALDVVRRQKIFREKEAEIIRLIEDRDSPAAVSIADQEIADDRLRMMFVCCHPLIPADAQAALALKTLCGFSAKEIAAAFLTTEASISKRLTRAKHHVREAGIPFEIPAGPELSRRLDGVLQSLYLLFNEGYKASAGDKLIREDICEEALRLAGLLVAHPAGNRPRVHALLALMLLNSARLPARVDAEGNLLRLEDQDRSLWDRGMIARGLYHIAQSAVGDQLTIYHILAGIAACHCSAGDYQSTDWAQILALYDRLAAFDASPVVALNRAVAVAQVHGPQAGLDALSSVQESLDSYYLLHAVTAEFERRLGHIEAAARHLRRAIALAENPPERAFLEKRLRACEAA